MSDFSSSYLMFGGLLTACVTVLQALLIILLFPLVHSIITGSFTTLHTAPVLNILFSWFPVLKEQTAYTFIACAVVLYVITIGKNILYYVSYIHTQTFVNDAVLRLRTKLFRMCVVSGKQLHDTYSVSSLHHVFTKIPTVLEAQYYFVQRFVTQCALVVMYLACMWVISWQLTGLLICIYVLVATLSAVLLQRMQHNESQAHVLATKLHAQVLEVLLASPIVYGFSKTKQEIARFTQTFIEELQTVMQGKRHRAMLVPFEEMSITTASLLLAGAIALSLDQYVIPQPASFFIFFFCAFHALRSISIFNQARMMVHQVEPITRTLQDMFAQQETFLIPEGNRVLSEITKGITCHALSFAYPDTNKQVLQNVSLHIPKGMVTALVGPTGSGKSTIMSLLLRLYDCPPESIYIDDVDIRSYTTDSLLQRISFVYQDALLFSGNILDNIAYGVHDIVEQSTIDEVLDRTQLRALIDTWDDGIYHTIGERGQQLSGGQKRLVAIARALMRTHDILILDEATNGLDSETEKRILDTILEIAHQEQKTVLMISHRLSSVARADHVVYLEHGTVVEEGAFTDLLKQQGALYTYWRLQYPHAPLPM